MCVPTLPFYPLSQPGNTCPSSISVAGGSVATLKLGSAWSTLKAGSERG